MEETGGLLASAEFWTAVAFVIFVVAAFRPAKRALVAALDARAERIRAQLEEASRLHEEAKSAAAAYQRKQREAVREAAEMVAQARKEAEGIAHKAREELEAALGRREAMARERIARAEAEAVRQVRNVAVEVAVAAARRLLAELVDPRRDAALVDRAIETLPRGFR